MVKAKDLRDQTTEELEAGLDELRHELFGLVNEYRQSRKLDRPHLLRAKRRDQARILTVLNERRAKVTDTAGGS